MSLADFKLRNPAYKDVPDAELADALYRKHYAGKIDRAEFDARMMPDTMAEDNLAARTANAQLLEDRQRGNLGARFAAGIAEPITGVGQMLVEAVGETDNPFGITPDSFRENIQDFRESKQRGQESLGRGSFDAAGLAGNIIGGAALAPVANSYRAAAATGAGLAALQPVYGDMDFASSKASQVAGGAIGGAGGQLLGRGLGLAGDFIGNRVAPLTDDVSTATGRAIRAAIGEDKVDDVVRMLRADQNPLAPGSAAEIASDAGSTKFSALQRAVDAQFPDAADARILGQQAARRESIDRIARPLQRSLAFRDRATTPLRERAMEMATDGIDSSGIERITRGLDDAADSPMALGTPAVKRLLSTVRRDFQQMKDPSTGRIDPEALYQYRKAGLDTTLRRVAQNDDAVAAAMTGNATGVKNLIDDAIEDASGGGWKNYLQTYEVLSRPVNRAQVGQTLSRTLTRGNKERGSTFLSALDDEAGLLKKSGVRGSSLDEVLGPQTQDLRRVQADLLRGQRTDEMAKRASAVGREAMGGDTPQLANALWREIMITNAVLRRLGEGQQETVKQELGRIFQRDPQMGFRVLADTIEKAPSAQKAVLRSMLDDFSAQMIAPARRAAPGVVAGEMIGQ